MNNLIKVLLVDDHEMVRIGVAAYLSAQPDIEVIGEAENGVEAIEKALALRPDLILMDNVMPIMTGAEATEKNFKGMAIRKSDDGHKLFR